VVFVYRPGVSYPGLYNKLSASIGFSHTLDDAEEASVHLQDVDPKRELSI